jgi:hypothetical protein
MQINPSRGKSGLGKRIKVLEVGEIVKPQTEWHELLK